MQLIKWNKIAVVCKNEADTIANPRFTYSIANIGILYISIPQPNQNKKYLNMIYLQLRDLPMDLNLLRNLQFQF